MCRSEGGEKEKEKAQQYGKGKAPVFYLFSSSPARLLFFHYCYFLGGYPAGTSAEERAVREKGNKKPGSGPELVPLTDP